MGLFGLTLKALTHPAAEFLRKALPFLLAVSMAIGLTNLPGVPWHNDVDLSFSALLNFAHQHRLRFGEDVVCTYGPLGFLIFSFFDPHCANARMLVNVLLAGAAVGGLFIIAWQMRIFSRCLLLVLFAWAAANLENRSDLIIETGLFCWGLLCFRQSGRRLLLSIVVFGALATFSLLAKSSFLLPSLVGIGLISCDLLARRGWALALGLVLGCVGAFLLGWLLMGQSLSDLGAFFINTISLIQGYNQALGLEGMPLASRSALALFIWLMVVVMLRTLTPYPTSGAGVPPATSGVSNPAITSVNRRASAAPQILVARRLFLLGWGWFITFTSWKHGFVRFDAGHAMGFLAFTPVAALAFEIFKSREYVDALAPTSRRFTRIGHFLAVSCAVCSLVLAQILFFPPMTKSLAQPWQSFQYNLGCLANPSQYKQQMNELLERKRELGQLPQLRDIVGPASADVFGQFQAHALWNGMQYTPRPVGQSYLACNRHLMRLNEQFYLSKRAPQYVLFDLHPLDHKFPALEDAWSLRDLLINYQLVAQEGRFGLLNARAAETPRLSLLREGDVAIGEQIALTSDHKSPLWLEIEVKPTAIGTLRQLFYRPALIRLAVWQKPEPLGPPPAGETVSPSPVTRHPSSPQRLLVRKRSPASMLAAGFLVSPLVVKNEDFFSLYGTNDLVRPDACSIELTEGDQPFWGQKAHFRLYQIENDFGGFLKH